MSIYHDDLFVTNYAHRKHAWRIICNIKIFENNYTWTIHEKKKQKQNALHVIAALFQRI